MELKEHKHKMNHVVIVTSDAADASVKQFRIRPWIVQAVVIVLCILIGAFIGCVVFEEQIFNLANQKVEDSKQELADAEAEKEELLAQLEELNLQIQSEQEKNQILSDTVNQYATMVESLQGQVEKMQMPTLLPITGSASIEEVSEGEPMCIFTASQGTTVVATANGTVETLVDDAEYGHVLTVNHGNGYKTIYKNQGDALVKVGDSVNQGTSLFIIGEDNTSLGYQIMWEEELIDPMDLLEISG